MNREKELERVYAYWLCRVEGIGDRTANALMEHFGSAQCIYEAPKEALQQILKPKQMEHFMEHRKCRNPEREYKELQNSGIHFLLQEDMMYPEKLREIPDPPFVLFYLGQLPREDVPSVAIIGARECSEYGKYVAMGLGKALGEQGVQVISGMARGVDGISQQAALEAGGTSFGVLGCGVDICYPAGNRTLYNNLLQAGGVISSFPPGTKPRPQNFPPRNRIVSGLADVVVVVEARAKSGTLITVDMALEQGREVYVVPGRITDRLSDGCNKLIKQGAGVILSPYDFLEEIRERFEHFGFGIEAMQGAVQAGKTGETKANRQEETDISGRRPLGPDEPKELQQVYEALDYEPQSIERIMERLPKDTQIESMQLNTILLRLCMMQVAMQLSPGYFSLKV